jgi:hypothetical protein
VPVTKDSFAKWAAKSPPPVTFTPDQLKQMDKMIAQVWEHNNQYMVDNDGRPYGDKDDLDLDGDANVREYNTYSETVGYKLFREVLVGLRARRSADKATEDKACLIFEKVWKWTDNNMRRNNLSSVYDIENRRWISTPGKKKDSLLAWRYVPTIEGGRGGIIHSVTSAPRKTDGVWIDGLDGAPDADLFVIAALRLAAILWPGKARQNNYLKAAKEMAAAVREKYVAKIGGENYLLGGDEFYKVNGLNPSYSFEAVYDMLAELDPPGRQVWQELKISSLKAAILGADATLHNAEGTKVQGKVNVPPNWLTYNGDRFGDMPWFDFRDYIMGWDGARTLWLKAAYFLYNRNPLALKYLTDNTGTSHDYGPFAFLKKEYRTHGYIQAGFGLDGAESDPQMAKEKLGLEAPFTNGIYLGYFYAAGDKEMASALLKRLSTAYQPTGTFEIHGKVEQDNYFSDHWAWFGLAMANGLVTDAFSLYKEWRVANCLPPVEAENMSIETLSAAAAKADQAMNLAAAGGRPLKTSEFWTFDGCQKNQKAIVCRGAAKGWYLGGSGTMLPNIGPFTGMLVNVEGSAGRIKLELSANNGKTYTYETLAISGENLYVPFDSFRQEINFQPTGEAFDRSVGAAKLQVIAIGTSETSPINFTVKEISLINRE